MTHTDVRELIPSYALGALEQDEAAVVQEHLEECAFCTNLAREAAEIAHLMPYAAAQRPAPAHCLDRLMSSLSHGGVATPQPAARLPEPVLPAGSRFNRWLSWLSGPVFAPLAAAAVLVIAMVGWNFSLMGELKEERQRMTALQNRLGQQTHLLVMVTSNSAVTRPLAGTPMAPSAEVRLIMDAQTNTAMLMAMRLPPLAANRVYQVWLGRQGARMPAGRLVVDEEGDGECTLALEDSIHSYDSAWITIEPAQGGPMPNSPGVARGVL